MVADWILALPWNLIAKHASDHNVDPRLVGAIISVESSGQPLACRYEVNWKYFVTPEVYARQLGITVSTETNHQATSWGLMQIMGSVAREMGHRDHLPKLVMPPVNLDFGCRFLGKLVGKYPVMTDAVASYNAGSPRKSPDGKYVNQAYVDKVMKGYGELS